MKHNNVAKLASSGRKRLAKHLRVVLALLDADVWDIVEATHRMELHKSDPRLTVVERNNAEHIHEELDIGNPQAGITRLEILIDDLEREGL